MNSSVSNAMHTLDEALARTRRRIFSRRYVRETNGYRRPLGHYLILCLAVLAAMTCGIWAVSEHSSSCHAARAMANTRDALAPPQTVVVSDPLSARPRIFDTSPAVTDYRKWAEDIRRNADRVNFPTLNSRAQEAAYLADKMARLHTQTTPKASGTGPKRAQDDAREIRETADNLTADLDGLSAACG